MTTTSDGKGLNILVCMKFLPDPNQLIVDVSGRPDLKRSPFRINTFDENAIEAALQLAAQHGGRVIGVSLCAEAPPRDVMLKALAMGVSALYLLNDEGRVVSDSFRVAAALAAGAQTIAARENLAWDLVLSGEASVDEYNEQVGPRLAAALDLPAVTYATKLMLEGRTLTAERGLEDRSEKVEVALPALATVGMEINTARMPTVIQIMGAGRKPIVQLDLTQLEGLDVEALKAAPAVETLEVFSPPSTRKQIVIKGDSTAEIVGELLRRLAADGEVKL